MKINHTILYFVALFEKNEERAHVIPYVKSMLGKGESIVSRHLSVPLLTFSIVTIINSAIFVEAAFSSVTRKHISAPRRITSVFSEAPVQKPLPSSKNVDEAFQPYRGEQPAEALPEIFIPQVLPSGVNEELLWVPQTDTVSFRPLCLCTSGGYYVNLLRVKGAGILSRHKVRMNYNSFEDFVR